MAKHAAVTVTFLFIILFAVSNARFPSDLAANDVTTNDLIPLTTNTILLPSEKPESEPATAVDLESEPEPEIVPESVPLTVVTFRPINHPRGPLFPLRHRHGCRHSRQFKQGGPRFHNHEVSYGNDMILSGGDGDGEVRQIPARWVRFHHGGARFPFKHDVEEREEFNRPHHHHQHHVHVHEHEHEHEHEHHRGGFMKGIRKFLNRF